MDARQIHQFDQFNAALRETYPPMMYSYYVGLIEAGFIQDDALMLTGHFQNIIMQDLLHARDSNDLDAPTTEG